jgi:general stress protein CsbA
MLYSTVKKEKERKMKLYFIHNKKMGYVGYVLTISFILASYRKDATRKEIHCIHTLLSITV